MKKKIAILLTGRIKGYKNVINNLINIKNTYNPIFFVSLNSDETREIKEFCEIFEITKDQLNLEPTVYPEYILSNLESYIHCNPKNVYSMFYHNYCAFSLLKTYQIKNNSSFDIIMKYRADIDSEDTIQFEKEIRNNNIYIPNVFNYKGVNDQIAYGDYQTMEKYSELVLKLEDMIKNNIILNGERMIKNHLKNEKIILKRFTYNYLLDKKRFENN
jgi:hypothetical protein